MTDSTTIDAATLDWASEQLDLELPAGEGERSRNLTSLLWIINRSDYVLSPDLADAAQIFSGAVQVASLPAATEAISLHRYERGQRAIADFKAGYFALSCEERSRRWESLVSEYSDQLNLNSQLGHLEQGLQISMPSDSMSSRQAYILRICRDTFLGSPSAAAHLRRVFCHQWRTDETWEDAVDELPESHGDLLQAIAPWIDEFGNQRFWEAQESQRGPIVNVHIEATATPESGYSYRRHSELSASSTDRPVDQPHLGFGVWAATIWICLTLVMIFITIVLLLVEGPRRLLIIPGSSIAFPID